MEPVHGQHPAAVSINTFLATALLHPKPCPQHCVPDPLQPPPWWQRARADRPALKELELTNCLSLLSVAPDADTNPARCLLEPPMLL